MAKEANDFSLERIWIENLLVSDPIILQIIPGAFVGVQLRRVWWQEKQFQPAIQAFDIFPDVLGLARRMAIGNQENGAVDIVDQAFEKFDENASVDLALDRNETEFALRADRRDHIEPETGPGTAAYGSLPFIGPGRARMMIGTDTGLSSRARR